MKIRSYLSPSNLARFPVPLTRREIHASLHGSKVIANSMPKAGTHLLTRVLELLPVFVPRWTYHALVNKDPKLYQKIFKIRKGQYVSGHLQWNQELINVLGDANIKTIFIVRDLRDIAFSNAYYMTYRNKSHRLHSYFNSLNSDDERLMASIVGVSEKQLKGDLRSSSLGENVASFLPWLDDENCLSVRFEDLIGSSGDGQDHKPMSTIRAIANYLNIDNSEEQIIQIAKNVFYKKSRTFRKGTIGDWRNHFTNEHKQAFKDICGDILIKMGYADGYDW
ncbi:sulfotransferase domain-containing protein [Coleofasciculus sp. E2-BRE-01]|uniref:sulfotransferase domain-containing protein n=1 Tax=Coleofasciculus sp. E2-BRE-01 TaxID=3069524 RepID=UPI0032F3716D